MNKNKKISRRDFLKIIILGLITAFIGSSMGFLMDKNPQAKTTVGYGQNGYGE
jgi:hypothetical protein